MLRVIARLNLGGPAHQVSLLSGRRFYPERYETLLVHGSLAAGEESMAALAEREGAHTEFVPDLVQPVRPRDLRATWKLRSIVRRFRPHIVHTHTAKAGFTGRLAALSTRPRPIIVHTYHGHVLEGYFGPAVNRAYRSLERTLARFSNCLIGVSQATVDDLVRLGIAPREQFRVIPLGLNLAGFGELDDGAGPRVRQELGVGPEEVLLSYVGRLVPIKRIDVMLRGVAQARRSGCPVRLAIVGDGRIRGDLEQLRGELGIGDAVTFVGYREDWSALAAAADIAVLSSANEGTPVSLIEAAAAGKPAIASAVGGVPEVVTAETGILFPSGDAGAFADAVVGLADDPQRRRQMGGTARRRALDHFSASRLINDIDALYTELLDSAPGVSKPGL